MSSLKVCQYSKVSAYLTSADERVWALINSCFRNIFQVPVFSYEALLAAMGKHTNALYCYLNLWLREKEKKEIRINLPCRIALYRAVWLSVENGTCQVLVKAPLYKSSMVAALISGARFSPNIDFIDGAGNRPYIFLTVEQHCKCQSAALTLANKIEDNKSQKLPPGHCIKVDDDKHFIRLPWQVNLNSNPPYHVYLLFEDDTWSFSRVNDLHRAYHECVH